MREILFRGKIIEPCKYQGQWLEGFYAVENGKPFIAIPKENGLNGFYCDPETIGQYTDIKDKSGKKVFEHDIVKAYDPLDEISFIGVVKYFDGSFYICDTEFCSYYRWMDYEVEVIGNIYDNPELLEVEEHERSDKQTGSD